jgi:hypothetical protein
MSGVAVLVLLAVPATVVAQSQSPGESPGTSSPSAAGGDLTIDVPDGAAPSGTTVMVAAHGPDARPDELKSVPTTLSFYEVQPDDVVFSAPASVTRTVTFGELGMNGFDPLLDGVIAAALFTRAPDGTWSWLDANQDRIDMTKGGYTITATIDHGGPVFAFVPGDLLLATEDTSTTPVGQSFRVEGQLRVDPSSGAEISTVTGTTSDETIAKAGDSYQVALFDRAEGLEFQCLAAGTVQYETTFTIHDVGDVGPLNAAIGLGPTDVDVVQNGEHTCQ